MAELNRYLSDGKNSNYRFNSAMLGVRQFLKFFWVTLNYTLSISHSPRALAIGGQWNVKIIESPLAYTLPWSNWTSKFLGQNYQTRDFSRVTRSKMNRSIFNPI